ncbi:MAG: hypothetical protein MRJ96_06920 [Nitrospirales bacterium]|nr:hypothetical protein [Nitrospirales bacterium]
MTKSAELLKATKTDSFKSGQIKPVKAWLASYVRYGIGFIPVGDGTWLSPPCNPKNGKLIWGQSGSYPISQLWQIPSEVFATFFRRVRKLLLINRLNRFFIGLSVWALVLGSKTQLGFNKSDLAVGVGLFFFALWLATILPLIFYGRRTKQFVTSSLVPVQSNDSAYHEIGSFNFFLL